MGYKGYAILGRLVRRVPRRGFFQQIVFYQPPDQSAELGLIRSHLSQLFSEIECIQSLALKMLHSGLISFDSPVYRMVSGKNEGWVHVLTMTGHELPGLGKVGLRGCQVDNTEVTPGDAKRRGQGHPSSGR